jgi:hypothetical protein
VIVCTKCGHRNPDDRRWCARCETFLDWDGRYVDPGTPVEAEPIKAEPPKKKRPVVPYLILIAIVVGAAVAVILVAAGSKQKPKVPATTVVTTRPGPTIAGVKFTGGSGAPVVTVTGRGFGSVTPSPDPASSPPAPAQCDNPTGNDGYDYGVSGLYLSDSSAGWQAGYAAPGDTNLANCIGVVVASWSPNRVVFSLGSAYGQEGRHLEAGDQYVLDVRGASTKGTVTYGG